jgi:menaquinone-9 beta-reductase
MGSANSDVLIVGAGPSGCAAGIVAARAGAKVTVLDRASFPRDKVCGDALSNDAVRLLGELHVADAVRRGPHALVTRGAAVFPDGSRVERAYDPPGWIARRYDLDQCLRTQLSAAGARVVEGTRVEQLVSDGRRVVGVRTSGGELRAPIVIAADGYGSVALPAWGAAPPKGRELAVSTTGYYRGVTFPFGAGTADHYFYAGLPCGYGWVFPAVDGLANVGVYVRADAYAKLGTKLDVLMASFLAAHPERFASATREGKLRTWSLPIAPRKSPRAADGLLTVGDAAGLVDPLSGEGIWQALHSGMVAAGFALRALERGRLDAALQAEYEQVCRDEIDTPSRLKRWVQDSIEVLVARGLYRWPPVFAMLRLGYQQRLLEMTKS